MPSLRSIKRAKPRPRRRITYYTSTGRIDAVRSLTGRRFVALPVVQSLPMTNADAWRRSQSREILRVWVNGAER